MKYYIILPPGDVEVDKDNWDYVRERLFYENHSNQDYIQFTAKNGAVFQVKISQIVGTIIQ